MLVLGRLQYMAFFQSSPNQKGLNWLSWFSLEECGVLKKKVFWGANWVLGYHRQGKPEYTQLTWYQQPSQKEAMLYSDRALSQLPDSVSGGPLTCTSSLEGMSPHWGAKTSWRVSYMNWNKQSFITHINYPYHPWLENLYTYIWLDFSW